MPLFLRNNSNLTPIEKTNFSLEKELQNLIETNLQSVFNCRLVASEYSTGVVHAGRIDTLALSEENNPVIIEYKKTVSSDLVNQSLFYLHWIQDHKGDFQLAVQKALGNAISVDWSEIRVICIAPGYRKYDLHAVKVMGANIELWKYTLFKNGTLHLEDEFQASKSQSDTPQITNSHKNPAMVQAGKKAALTKATGVYSFDEHLEGKPSAIRNLSEAIRNYILSLDEAIEEVPKKFYVAYKISQNFVCLEPRTKDIRLYLKLKSTDIANAPRSYRDVTSIGHYGTGDSEFTISTDDEFKEIISFVDLAYSKVGG